MCSRIAVEDKALPAPGFPEGWKFCFNSGGANLKLLSPNGRHYKSIESAMTCKSALTGADVTCFLDYVGLHQSGCTLSSERKVGSFCYAKFADGTFYRGFITKVSGYGSDRSYSVRYR
jgi:hypothetical protein